MLRNKFILATSLVATLCGCTTTSQNLITPTATEQMLVSDAAERAISEMIKEIKHKVPTGSKLFIEANVSPTAPSSGTTVGTSANDRYILTAVRQHLDGDGYRVVADRQHTDMVLVLAIGADSIDDLHRVIGLPAMRLPESPWTPGVGVPEISAVSQHDRMGIVKLRAIVTDTSDKFVTGVGPIFGEAKITSHHVLTAILFGEMLERPDIRAGVE